MEPFPYLCHFMIFPLTKFSFFKGWLPLVLNFKKPNWKMFGLKTNCLDWIARETFNRRKVQVKNDLYQLTKPFNRKVDSTIPSISWHTSIKPSGICQSSSVLSWIHSHAVIWSCLWFAWILCIMEKVKEESQKEWFNQLKTTRFIGQSVGGYGSSWEVSGRSWEISERSLDWNWGFLWDIWKIHI